MRTPIHTKNIHLLKIKSYHILLLSKVLSPPHLRRIQAKLLSQVFNTFLILSMTILAYTYRAPPYSSYMSLTLKLSDPSLDLIF